LSVGGGLMRLSPKLRLKLSRRQQGVLWFCFVLLFLATSFTITYIASHSIYQWIGQTPTPLVSQLITSMGGILLTGIIITVLTRVVFKSKLAAGQMRVFGPIFDAMQRIAKGDFSVRVDKIGDEHSPEEGIFGELVKNVNQMAAELNQMETMRQEF